MVDASARSKRVGTESQIGVQKSANNISIDSFHRHFLGDRDFKDSKPSSALSAGRVPLFGFALMLRGLLDLG